MLNKIIRKMSNISSLDENFTWAQEDLDSLWQSINNTPSDRFFSWISRLSFTFALLGSISNFMSVIVLLKLSTQLSTFVYLTSLSISDMITCLSVMLMESLEYLVQTRRSTTVTIYVRHTEIVLGAIAAGSRVLSFWISTAVTMDRWILICYPIYGKRFCTLNHARTISRILFFIAFLYSVPLCFEYEVISMPSLHQMIDLSNQTTSMDDKHPQNSMLITKGYTDLARRRAYRWFYLFFNGIFVYVFPTSTIVFFNIQLISVLRRLKARSKLLCKKNHHFQTSQRRRFHRSKYSVTLLVITMVLALVLCRSPTIVLWILWSFEFSIKIFFDSSFSPIVRRFHHLANLIAILNAATNFLPFCVFGQLFRAECLTIYCCKKPTSEQLARRAKRRYKQKYQHLKRNSRSKLNTLDQQTTQYGRDMLRTMPSNTSESTTGVTPSSNDQLYATNILRLSDPPYTLNGNIQQQSNLIPNNTSIINETSDL